MLLAAVQVPTLKTNAMIAAWIERGIALLSFHAGTSFTKDFEMKQVKLGSQGLVVSAEGLGCMGMSAFYGPSDEQENLSTLARAIEHLAARARGGDGVDRTLGLARQGDHTERHIAPRLRRDVGRRRVPVQSNRMPRPAPERPCSKH